MSTFGIRLPTTTRRRSERSRSTIGRGLRKGETRLIEHLETNGDDGEPLALPRNPAFDQRVRECVSEIESDSLSCEESRAKHGRIVYEAAWEEITRRENEGRYGRS